MYRRVYAFPRFTLFGSFSFQTKKYVFVKAKKSVLSAEGSPEENDARIAAMQLQDMLTALLPAEPGME